MSKAEFSGVSSGKIPTAILSQPQMRETSSTQLVEMLSGRLTVINAVQSAGKTPQDLAVIISYLAKQLEGEDAGAVRDALDVHCRRSNRFPTLHDILEILPSVRRADTSRLALPEKSAEHKTPGIHLLLARLTRDRVSGEQAASVISQFRALHEKCVRCGQKWPFESDAPGRDEELSERLSELLMRSGK